ASSARKTFPRGPQRLENAPVRAFSARAGWQTPDWFSARSGPEGPGRASHPGRVFKGQRPLTFPSHQISVYMVLLMDQYKLRRFFKTIRKSKLLLKIMRIYLVVYFKNLRRLFFVVYQTMWHSRGSAALTEAKQHRRGKNR
ncbi:MAG: hypothetical protein IJ157_10090, partial [Clostridia bacterium]|nr:hypothetical protein [Clostridia bacterium]